MREFKRSARVGDLLCREISSIILRDITDPRVEMVTITGAKVSDDLRHAAIFFSVIGDENRWKEASKGLTSSRGYIKRELGKRLEIKYIPDLKFIQDKTMETGSRIDKMISDALSDHD
ncbi:MAG: 30S ribosome-binding factor RbfA [bacterium]|nr:30S ribosome-binding factor RbfA [bacterium]